ncbi:MAG: 3-oxoacyl-[acyl-carrier-protein] reductase [Clostridia bacterium]|jgi:3-oxoacyl-[acyl-carrier protein] reductase|nr:3-oxoacyl-[acyl-carrier-protein] reductase [Clostridia bacterium]
MLKGKTAVITGAAKGIGFAIAVALAKKGCNIVINYRSHIKQEVIDTITALGVKCLAIKSDVSKFNEAEELVKTAKKEMGSVDVLVNNAGITKDGLLMRMSEVDFDSVINTNLKGAFNTTRHAAGIMLRQKEGAIINISSVVGLIGNAGQANYAASKAGIIGLTKSTARELASRGITCNAVAPGFIETDMTNVLNDEQKKKMTDNIPLKAAGKPEDVASAVVFLAENRYITGQVLNVDGGMVMN